MDAVGKLADVFAERLQDEVRRAFERAPRFALAIPGGSVASRFLPRMARAGVDWPRVDLFWCDERVVPPDHPDSNYRLAREVWLDAARRIPGSVHPMAAEQASPDVAAAAYEHRMTEVIGRPPRLDVALLGVGEDGHVCSLFPGRPLLEEAHARVGVEPAAPKPPPVRLSLTLPALAEARLVVVAAFGAGKAAAVREALDDPQSPLPLARVLARARRALVLLDPEAAGRAGGPGV